MDIQDITELAWAQLPLHEKEDVCHEVTKRLPKEVIFRNIFEYSQAGISHSVPVFTWNLLAFSLIFGGEVTLGYDPLLASPTEAARDSWLEETFGDYIPISLDDFLAKVMSPVRTVTLKPFLLQAIPIRLGANTPDIIYGSYSFITHQDVTAIVEQEGFTLPSHDEWEYANAAESRTLFRWGSDYPLGEDEGPIDIQKWRVHRESNAFGLTFSSDPYLSEFCQTLGILCGGDGGTASDSGAGIFMEWLPLASTYQNQWRAPLSRAYYRRVLHIS
jgi:hypothetical protein